MIDLPEFDAKEFIEQSCKFIKEKVESSNSEGVVIGLSGGIDSSVVACLAVKALGNCKVRGYILPSTTTSDQDLYDAKLIKDELDIESKYISISDIHDQYLSICNEGEDKENELAVANLKPRIRMSILYYFAALHNSLVIGTGNKTELEVGYFTKYGDGGVDLLPIGDLYKEEVKKVALELGVPESIIKKPPSAGLMTNQTDEGELGITYNVLDRILHLYVDEKYDVNAIAEKIEIPLNEVERIVAMVDNAEHKRVSIPILNKYANN